MRIVVPPRVGRAVTGAKPDSHQLPWGEIPMKSASGSGLIFLGAVAFGATL
jgi:hypothetical protein